MNFRIPALVLAAAFAGTAATAEMNFGTVDNYFEPGQSVIQIGQESFSTDSTMEGTEASIGMIQTDAAGTLNIYALNGEVRGDLLQTIEIAEGTSNDVQIDFGVAPPQKIQAVLLVGGTEVAAKAFTVEDTYDQDNG